MRIKLLSFIIVLLNWFQAHTQGFFKVYPPNGYESFTSLIPAGNNHYAFTTSNCLYLVDDRGEVIFKKQLMAGISSSLESVVMDGVGNFIVASHVFETIDDQKRVIYKLDAVSNLVDTREFVATESFSGMKLIYVPNGLMIFSTQTAASGKSYIQGISLDAAFNVRWSKIVSLDVYNRFSVRQTGNSATLCYLERLGGDVWTTRVDPDGSLTHLSIRPGATTGKIDFTESFSPTSDGGNVFIGTTVNSGTRLPDGFIFKADAGGFIEWQRHLNIFLRDRFSSVIETDDGYFVLGDAGSRDYASEVQGDWILLKLDLQGNEIWRKAFGGSRADQTTMMIMDNDKLIFGGRSSHTGYSIPIPALCMTDLDGNFNTQIAVPLSPATDMKTFNLQLPEPYIQLVTAMPAGTGEMIVAGNEIDTDDDQNYATLSRHNQQGGLIWKKRLSAIPGLLKFAKRTSPGSIVIAIERKDFLSNTYELICVDDDGNVKWTSNNASSNLRDIIATSDGGYMIVGSEDVSFVNYNIILIKLDATGGNQWRRTIGRPKQWETGRQIIETPDHHFLIVGNNQIEFDDVSRLYALKVDQAGNLIWEKTFNGPLSATYGTSVGLTNDGNYLLAGFEDRFPFGNKDMLFVKINTQGDVIWERRLNFFLSEEVTGIQALANGKFLVSGNTGEPMSGKLEKYALAMQLDADGQMEWTKFYGTPGFKTTAAGFTFTGTGDTMMTGTRQTAYGNDFTYFVKLNGITPQDPVSVYSELQVYPNPANGWVTLMMSNSYAGPVSVSIFDALGKLCSKTTYQKTTGRFQQSFSTDKFAAGVYMIRVMTDQVQHVRSLMVVPK